MTSATLRCEKVILNTRLEQRGISSQISDAEVKDKMEHLGFVKRQGLPYKSGDIM